MIVFEAKLQGTDDQYRVIDEMLRTGRFVRNACLRYWMDNRGVGRLDLNKYCKVLSDNPEFPWVSKLNSIGLHKQWLRGHGRQLRDSLITARRIFPV